MAFGYAELIVVEIGDCLILVDARGAGDAISKV